MRELTMIDWFSAAFVVVILVFAFQPLVWIRTIKGINRLIEWGQNVSIETRIGRSTLKSWGLGMSYECYIDFGCRLRLNFEAEAPISSKIGYHIFNFQGLLFSWQIRIRTEKRYEV